MKEAIHVYKTARQVHFKELKPQGRLRVYHVSIPSIRRLGRWLVEHPKAVLSRSRSLAGVSFIIERRER